MAESDSSKFSESVGKTVREYTWLIVDAFILLLLLTSLLGYKEFDAPMRAFLRGAIVAFWWHAWLSGLHLLVFLRHVDRSKPMPAYASYPIYGAKLIVISAFAWWCFYQGIFKL